MRRFSFVLQLLACLGFALTGGQPVLAVELAHEYVTTTPVLVDGVLYVASTIDPWQRSRLRAIDILNSSPVTLWDAAEKIPLAGVGADPGAQLDSDPPNRIALGNRYRSIFTNLLDRQLPLTADLAATLQGELEVATTMDAAILLHAVRGRRGGSPAQVAGTTEDPLRLWTIGRSSPLVVDRSATTTAGTPRDRMLYVGAGDGMLHGFYVSRWDDVTASYLHDDPEGGRELWAYLPGSFLPHLKDQPLQNIFGELAVHLDGTPVVAELYLDLDGDGQHRWQTVLAATGTLRADRRSCLFILDITDPYQPTLLWEKLLPGEGVGSTRGVTLGSCGGRLSPSTCVYLTAASATAAGVGIHALSIELETGELRWQFSAPYAETGGATAATPAAPALMDLDGDDNSDTVVFGDMAGRLWALGLEDGRAYGDAPAYQLPGRMNEPIGAGVAVFGRLAIFGSGGVEEADDNGEYAIYALEILPEGAILRWRYPLAPGEQVWNTPTIDASGNLLFGTAIDYAAQPTAESPGSGRLLVLDKAGQLVVSRDSNAATIGQVVTAPGVAVSVAVTGAVTQIGTASRLSGASGRPGRVRLLSWRPR